MAKTENWQKKDDVFKAYERAIKELGDVARRVPKNTIIEKAMSYPAPRYYITLEVAIRNISLMYRGIQPDMYNPMKIDMYDSIFRKFVAKGLKYPGYSYWKPSSIMKLLLSISKKGNLYALSMTN